MKQQDKQCPKCGCEKEICGRQMVMLCPWCDEAEMVAIAKEALRKNAKRIELGLVKK